MCGKQTPQKTSQLQASRAFAHTGVLWSSIQLTTIASSLSCALRLLIHQGNMFTTNLAVYGELGCFPFSLLAKQRALKFWIKVMNNPLSPQYQLYNEQCNMNNANSWAKRVHSIKDNFDFRNAKINFNENMSYFNLFKARLCDQFVQEWQASINNRS